MRQCVCVGGGRPRASLPSMHVMPRRAKTRCGSVCVWGGGGGGAYQAHVGAAVEVAAEGRRGRGWLCAHTIVLGVQQEIVVSGNQVRIIAVHVWVAGDTAPVGRRVLAPTHAPTHPPIVSTLTPPSQQTCIHVGSSSVCGGVGGRYHNARVESDDCAGQDRPSHMHAWPPLPPSEMRSRMGAKTAMFMCEHWTTWLCVCVCVCVCAWAKGGGGPRPAPWMVDGPTCTATSSAPAGGSCTAAHHRSAPPKPQSQSKAHAHRHTGRRSDTCLCPHRQMAHT
jgi:hypothetical protein